MQVVFSPRSAQHDPRTFLFRGRVVASPEQPRRAEVLLEAAKAGGHQLVEPDGIDPAALARVHDAGFLDYLRTAHAAWSALPEASPEVTPNIHPNRNMGRRPAAIVGLAGYYAADTAVPIGAGSWEGALASAACAAAGARLLLAGADHAYALCRPPGHHAYADMAGGFCLLNNVAIAAQMMRDGGAGKVAILDIDVHHGNGTQGIFWRRGDVLTVSVHGDPAGFYPFYTGYADELGEGPGEGANLNIPLPRGAADDGFLAALDTALGAVGAFQPDALLVALGLDASRADPLAFLAVTADGFAEAGRRIGAFARPALLVQEGGYLSPELGSNLLAFLAGFEAARRGR